MLFILGISAHTKKIPDHRQKSAEIAVYIFVTIFVRAIHRRYNFGIVYVDDETINISSRFVVSINRNRIR